MAVEIEWEAHFKPNFCGFIPEQGWRNAKPKYVMNVDISKYFDRRFLRSKYILIVLVEIGKSNPTQNALIHELLHSSYRNVRLNSYN